MKKNFRLLLLFVLSFFCVTAFRAARAEDGVPTYKVLKCGFSCPHVTDPVPIDRTAPHYPPRYTGSTGVYAEAFVQARYTIGKDGHVKDAEIEQIIGPRDFATSVLQALKRRRFKPAMSDGKPIEVNQRASFIFMVKGRGRVARASVATAYRHAIHLAGEGKEDAAIAALQAIEDEDTLNFYERTHVAYAMTQLYLDQKKDAQALTQIRIATIRDGEFLDPANRTDALRLRVELEAEKGDLADALIWFNTLRKYADIGEHDPDAIMVARLYALLDSPTPISTPVTLSDEDGQPWRHSLLRRRFTFVDLQGDVRQFELRCHFHGIESAVSDKAQWTVPKSWSSCVLYVTGSPGSRFSLVEFHAQKTSHAASQK